MYSRRDPATPELAARKWSNVNTFVALLVRCLDVQNVPILAPQVVRARVTLALALEYSPTTHWGNNVAIHAPAAAQWLRIAGGEVEEWCKGETGRMKAGDIWVARGGGEVCDLARLAFWRQRLRELGISCERDEEDSYRT
jgi:hypothetical protein